MRLHRISVNIGLFLLLTACVLLPSNAPVTTIERATVIAHPDGSLYVGDQVSFEVLPPAGMETSGHQVEIKFEGKALGTAGFAPSGLGGRIEATLWWVWDTRDLEPGRYTLTFTSLPEGPSWTETYSLHPASRVPPPEPGAHWNSAMTVCCSIYTITGTDAERDLSSLGRIADQQSGEVADQMGTSLERKITLILLPRVVGHGGFTLDGVYVSYLVRNYVANKMDILLHHEFVHVYDGQLGGDYRPSILQEGLAVYLTGGHFKPEPLELRAAALFLLNDYIHLQPLADNFYQQQHEIGYLEAGALVKYLVEKYGWPSFNEFYRAIPTPQESTPSAAIDASLRDHLGISFTDLERDFLKSLQAQTVTPEVRDDLRLTIRLLDTIRRYQQVLDPSAYFLTAWMPDASIMRQRGIVADFLRHPQGFDNRLVESLFIRADQELLAGNFKGAERTLNWIDWILTVISP